jgi:hypothetical protein
MAALMALISPYSEYFDGAFWRVEVDEVPVDAPVWVIEELIAGFQVKTSGLHASFVGG